MLNWLKAKFCKPIITVHFIGGCRAGKTVVLKNLAIDRYFWRMDYAETKGSTHVYRKVVDETVGNKRRILYVLSSKPENLFW